MASIAIPPIQERDLGSGEFRSTTIYDDTLRFYLNGKRIVLDEIDPEVTLLDYLRSVGLTGTKLGCGEGGCGACTVVVSQYNPTTQKIYHGSVNACLAPLVSVDGKHVITIEGVGTTEQPHPTQERVARWNGSQCGFCTPGIVMSLYALLRNNAAPDEHEVEEAFDGNLCRCTGYRPILDAAHTFSTNRGERGKSRAKACGAGCCMENGDKAFDRDRRCRKGNEEPPATRKTTPPGFIEYKPDTELIFPPALKKHEFRPLALGNKRKRWYRPVTLEQLLELKSVYPAAKLVGGSSETQIEIKFKALQYPLSVFVGDIPELRRYALHKDHVELGGNVILTDLETICQEAIQKYGEQQGQVFTAIYKQLKYFAGRQIRNVGTPAGNLVTASPISDLNPVFLASDATLVAKTLSAETEIPMSGFFTGYRRTALPPDGILAFIRIPITQKNEYFRAYKQAKRKDDDIAIVTAAFRLRLDEQGVVEEANLVYGGMAAMTVAAQGANKYLKGRRFAELDTLEGAMNALGKDFDLEFGVPGGMASYRKSLALGFFYRFYHDVMMVLGEKDRVDDQAVAELERGLSHGEEDRHATAAYVQDTVGQSQPHLAALKQTTGEAQYTDDIAALKNELHACLVLSTKPHARIKSVDYSAALDISGVVDYVDKDDMPSPEANRWGAPHLEEMFFAEDIVYTVGQPIAAMLATSAARAQEGARAVRVEYEELPAIFTIEEAIEQESFFKFFKEIKRGEPEEAFKTCHHVFTGIARMGGQEHFYLETIAALVVPKPEDGEMEMFVGTQNPNETQAYAAQVCNVQSNKVVVRVKRLGGGFGGKETRTVQLSSILALAAKKTKRPVRCMLTREEDMVTSGQRHPFLGRWKVGVDKDGKILAVDLDIFNNGGWSWDLSAPVCERALSHTDNCYYIPNMHVRGRLCRTNTMSNTAFRGFGGPQGMFICETYMEEVADRLGIPVEQFREINMYKAGDTTHFNQALQDWHVPLMYQQVRSEADYEARRQCVERFNRTFRWRKRGLALIPTKFGISFTALWFNQAGALVHIYHDGSVLVAHGGTEMGQGLHTKMAQIAAQALGVHLESVHISETATNTVINASATAASASSDLNGYAIHNACAQLNERLAPYRERLGPHASMRSLAHAAYFDRVNLSAQGFYKTPDIGYVWGENRGQMFFYFTQGVAACEVEVDTLTGTWTCLRADLKMDVGRSINPAIDYGQIQGAFVQGLGLFTMEESLWLRNGAQRGHLFTRGPGTYKIPGFRDVPQDFRVSLLKGVEWKNLRTIQRSRGVGEPPLFMGSAVFFAIRDALKAAREQYGVRAGLYANDAGDGLLRLESPATAERIRLACVDPIMERARVVPRDGQKSFFIAI